MSTTAAERAARRAARSPRTAQLVAWRDAALAAAGAEGRELPSAAVHPSMPDAVFLGAINAIGQRPPLERLRHCLACVREELARGDLRRAEYALCTACSLLPREEDEGGSFGLPPAATNAARDALVAGLDAVLDGDAAAALAAIGDWLDGTAELRSFDA